MINGGTTPYICLISSAMREILLSRCLAHPIIKTLLTQLLHGIPLSEQWFPFAIDSINS